MAVVWPFKSTPSPTPPGVPIVAPGASYDDSFVLGRINQLETRLERLEMDAAERQLKVLNTIEKVMHQLRARESRRVARQEQEEEEAQLQLGAGDGSSQLSKRFRRW